jgi:hypothetical protein
LEEVEHRESFSWKENPYLRQREGCDNGGRGGGQSRRTSKVKNAVNESKGP